MQDFVAGLIRFGAVYFCAVLPVPSRGGVASLSAAAQAAQRRGSAKHGRHVWP